MKRKRRNLIRRTYRRWRSRRMARLLIFPANQFYRQFFPPLQQGESIRGHLFAGTKARESNHELPLRVYRESLRIHVTQIMRQKCGTCCQRTKRPRTCNESRLVQLYNEGDFSFSVEAVNLTPLHGVINNNCRSPCRSSY